MKIALCLLSTGIDSPVAIYIMQSQGYRVDAIHFDNYGNKNSVEKLKGLIGVLNKNTKKKVTLYYANYSKMQENFSTNCNRRFQCILCKRGMYRASEKFAIKNKYDFLLTGENLGQVASQTLMNMAVLDNAVTIPILRPLLTYDKEETIKKSILIGTYEISIKDAHTCPYVPTNPLTKAKLEQTIFEEGRIEYTRLLDEVIQSIEKID
ncbi:MAG: 7-cyano-7-deazaguanine synthase [archaeon]